MTQLVKSRLFFDRSMNKIFKPIKTNHLISKLLLLIVKRHSMSYLDCWNICNALKAVVKVPKIELLLHILKGALAVVFFLGNNRFCVQGLTLGLQSITPSWHVYVNTLHQVWPHFQTIYRNVRYFMPLYIVYLSLYMK